MSDLWSVVGAKDAFDEALKLDPANAQAKSGLAAVERTIESEGAGGPGGGLGNIFNDPQIFQKLAANPKTSGYLADPSFMQTLQRIRQNPNDISAALQDQRMLQVMGVLMGIDMNFMGGKGGDGEIPNASGSKEVEEDVPMPDLRPTTPPETAKAAPPPSQPEPEPQPEDEDAVAAKKVKEEAEVEKKLGTENYKKRNFDVAIQHYDKAWALHKDITYLTNKSAAQFEKGDYEAAIETCKTAIQEGREVLADFKIIAKSVTFSASFSPAVLTVSTQSLRPDRQRLRKAQRPASRHRKLPKITHRAPHSRHSQQAARGRESANQSRERRLHQPRRS